MPDKGFSSIVAANGTATVTIKTGGYQTWKVTQVSNDVPTAPSGALAKLKKNGRLITPMVATNGVASGEPPVDLLPQETMTVEWTGMTPGTQVNVNVIYEVM
jgi:hypothetical protein